MYISPPRKNKDGSTSYTFRCSTKTACGFEPHAKSFRVPPDITGKKAIEEWKIKQSMSWKEELEHCGTKYTVPQNHILFIDFARQYNEQLLAFNPTGYAHYNANNAHIKTMTPKLGKYLLTEMTPLVIQSFCQWLIERRYDKYIITAKPALSMQIGERHIALHCIADGCKIAHSTLFSALHGENISKATATKICDYLQIPFTQYFNIIKESKPYSYSANNGIKVFIHGVLHEAVRRGLIERNYASKDYIRPVTGTKGTKLILESADEYKRFIECMNAEPDLRKKAAFALFIFSGLRCSEIAGLSWDSVDLENSTISVVQNTIYAGKKWGVLTRPTKTKSSNRKIMIPQCLTVILQQYKCHWKERFGELWEHTDKLFVTSSGKDMCGSTLAGWWREWVEKNGLKRITAHGMRHSLITTLIKEGVDVKTVSGIVGHSTSNFTVNNQYGHTKSKIELKQSINVNESDLGKYSKSLLLL